MLDASRLCPKDRRHGIRKSSRAQDVAARCAAGRVALPPLIVAYVRWVEAVGHFFGRVCMLLVFVMIGILLYSAFMRTGFNRPPLWTVEMAQFLLTAYYILGGAWTLQLGSHVRMDLLYERWQPRKRAFADTITSVCLITYLVVMLMGGISSTAVCARVRPARRDRLAAAAGADQDRDVLRPPADDPAGRRLLLPRPRDPPRPADRMSPELIALTMFASMLVLLLTGPARVRRDRLRRRGRRAAALGHRRPGDPVQPGLHPDELVPAADDPAVHLHGLHLLRERHRRRPLQDLPRLVRPGARRARHRHHRADGGDLGDERPLGRRHGDRRHRRAARAAEARLRQDHGHRRRSRAARPSAS